MSAAVACRATNREMGMLVGVNAAKLKAGWGGGAERYLRAVLAAMRSRQVPIDIVVFTGPGSHDSFEGYERIFVEPPRSLLKSDASVVAREARRAGVDVLLSQMDDAPVSLKLPQVLITMGLHGRCAKRQEKRLQQIIQKTAAFIAPSEYVRKQLSDLGAALNRVAVAPWGLDPAFSQPQPCIVKQPYLLAVGDTRPFKEVERLQHLFTHVRGRLPHTLVVVGRPCEGEPAEWGARVLRVESCASRYLAALYQHCDACVHVPHSDGAAPVVLEAMRSGAPLVAWRAGAVVELAGDVPSYPVTDTVSAWAATLLKAIDKSDPNRQKRLQVGRQLAAEHTWERAVRKIVSTLQDSANAGR